MSQRPEQVYSSSPRLLFWLGALGAVTVVALLFVASWGNRVVPPEMGDFVLRSLAVYFPVLFAIGLGSLVSLAFRAFYGKEIRLTELGLCYSSRLKSGIIEWELLSLSKPRRSSATEVARVTDGVSRTTIERLLFPDYDPMVREIERRRRARVRPKKRHKM